MILKQHRIYRSDLKENPHVLYVFGDNRERQGMGGQAKEMRGEPNAVGIRTKWVPSMEPHAFFSDDDYDEIERMIMEDFKRLWKHLESGGIVVLPSDGIGSGLADLKNRAPRVNAFLEELIEELDLH